MGREKISRYNPETGQENDYVPEAAYEIVKIIKNIIENI